MDKSTASIINQIIYILEVRVYLKRQSLFHISIVAPCSHCYLPPSFADGPCRAHSKNSAKCVNQAGTKYCSTHPSDFYQCHSSAGKWLLRYIGHILHLHYKT